MYQKKGCRNSKTAETAGTSAMAGTPARARMPATETAAARIPRESATANIDMGHRTDRAIVPYKKQQNWTYYLTNDALTETATTRTPATVTSAAARIAKTRISAITRTPAIARTLASVSKDVSNSRSANKFVFFK
jgi:hypothetical protein